MPLAMSRPWKHPRTGVYYLRKGVPDDLRQLVCESACPLTPNRRPRLLDAYSHRILATSAVTGQLHSVAIEEGLFPED